MGRLATLALILVAVAVRPTAQEIWSANGGPDPHEPWSEPIVPAASPFSLGSYDVIDAVWLIRRAGFLQRWDYENRPETVAVRTVSSAWVGYDPNAYEGHRNRYTIILNGEPIDWNHLYVEYAGDMLNLRLLYTYRNQKPPPDLPYRLRWP
ncbi:MAG: hypothetical protein ACOC7V_07825 [Spirochaetota bacterium]